MQYLEPLIRKVADFHISHGIRRIETAGTSSDRQSRSGDVQPPAKTRHAICIGVAEQRLKPELRLMPNVRKLVINGPELRNHFLGVQLSGHGPTVDSLE